VHFQFFENIPEDLANAGVDYSTAYFRGVLQQAWGVSVSSRVHLNWCILNKITSPADSYSGFCERDEFPACLLA
jgi:hypothetical protein